MFRNRHLLVQCGRKWSTKVSDLVKILIFLINRQKPCQKQHLLASYACSNSIVLSRNWGFFDKPSKTCQKHHLLASYACSNSIVLAMKGPSSKKLEVVPFEMLLL